MGRRFFVLLVATVCFTGPAAAQDRETPYWASLRYNNVNMRVGPSERYPIDWVYKREGLPVKVVRLKDGWRLVQDHEGTQGWMLSTQLNPRRMAMVVGEGLAAIRAEPSDGAVLRWNAEAGVIGELGDCEAGWCVIDVDGRSGWMRQARLWGAGDP